MTSSWGMRDGRKRPSVLKTGGPWMVRGCFSLILTWAEGTEDSTCSPTPAILRRGLRDPGTSLLTWSPAPVHGFPTLFQKLCSAEGWTVSRRPRPACGRAAGWHCWFYGNNDTSSIYFPSETILVGAGLRCSSCRTARDREQRARHGAFSLLQVQAPFTDEQPLIWPHHRSGSRSRPADPPRSPPRAQSWSETSVSPAVSQTPAIQQAGSPPK